MGNDENINSLCFIFNVCFGAAQSVAVVDKDNPPNVVRTFFYVLIRIVMVKNEQKANEPYSTWKGLLSNSTIYFHDFCVWKSAEEDSTLQCFLFCLKFCSVFFVLIA